MAKQFNIYTKELEFDGAVHPFFVERKFDGLSREVHTAALECTFVSIIIYDDMVVIDCALGKLLLDDRKCEYLKKRYETDNMLDIILSHYREIYGKYF